MLTSDAFHQILQESEILGDLFFHQVLQESEIVLGWMELGFQPGFENSLKRQSSLSSLSYHGTKPENVKLAWVWRRQGLARCGKRCYNKHSHL
ncbi:hypothetical protein B0680_08360 [Moraxella pluranimalium]|uniref:Uncharacterized protein n=1 Tax=Moraxella pluranimalium TaxID=470453 RepID=A0A1T0CLA0_9GAMM|nr:hypothetical protein B0680_08360 [Moraxella pluranimalium]